MATLVNIRRELSANHGDAVCTERFLIAEWLRTRRIPLFETPAKYDAYFTSDEQDGACPLGLALVAEVTDGLLVSIDCARPLSGGFSIFGVIRTDRAFVCTARDGNTGFLRFFDPQITFLGDTIIITLLDVSRAFSSDDSCPPCAGRIVLRNGRPRVRCQSLRR